MAGEAHLVHLEKLWADDGPLLASLAPILAAVHAPRPQRPKIGRRKAAELLIETLMERIDGEDGDADFEPDGEAEPSMGWSTLDAQAPSLSEPDFED